MLSFDKLKNLLSTGKALYEIFQEYERSSDSSFKKEDIRSLALRQLNDMKDSIRVAGESSSLSFSGMSGLDSKKIKELLDQSSSNYKQKGSSGMILLNNLLIKVLYYAIAVLEENQRMGKIVACPTAGSCGIVPACIVATAEEYGIEEQIQINALLTAGGIGELVSNEVQLAGAVAGCQAECGVAAAMAAGAVTYMLGGNNLQILSAAALSLKNNLGLVCDPIAGLVEVPCVKRNGILGVQAIVSAQMALIGISSIVPLEEVVEAMKEIGQTMSYRFKETSEGGLAVSKTGLRIKKELEEKWSKNNF